MIYYEFGGNNVNVDALRSQLVNYGITNIKVNYGPINRISVILNDPLPWQQKAVQEIFFGQNTPVIHPEAAEPPSGIKFHVPG